MPLCSKPDCSHNDYTCNAYLASSYDVNGIRIYEDKIYWLAYEDSNLNFMRMNVDGTDHEVLFHMDYTTNKILTYLSANKTWVLHRGYIYIAGTVRRGSAAEEPIQLCVYAIPMDGKEIITVMDAQVPKAGGGFCFIKPVRNKLYISVNYYRTEEIEDEPYRMGAFYCWDSKTRQGEYLFGQESYGGNCETYFERYNPLPVPGDGLYYPYYKMQGDSSIAKAMKLSFQTGTLEEAVVLPEKFYPDFTEEYIISSDSTSVSVY